MIWPKQKLKIRHQAKCIILICDAESGANAEKLSAESAGSSGGDDTWTTLDVNGFEQDNKPVQLCFWCCEFVSKWRLRRILAPRSAYSLSLRSVAMSSVDRMFGPPPGRIPRSYAYILCV